MNVQKHVPVLLEESAELLRPTAGERVLDLTLGLAGHASKFAEMVGDSGELIGIDADTDNLVMAKEILANSRAKCEFHHANFRELEQLNIGTFDVIFADLGVSSPHFDDASRGFSFRFEGPLDMRLDRTTGMTAAQYIQDASAEELADAFYLYGEIRQSRKLAQAAKEKPPITTTDLKAICDELFGFKSASLLPQVFQALRIAVNDEMGALAEMLATAPTLLNHGGRFGVIAFHSLEDRMVKRHFKEITAPEIDDLTGATVTEAPYSLLTRKAIQPSDKELAENPRSRSARLRGIQRV